MSLSQPAPKLRNAVAAIAVAAGITLALVALLEFHTAWLQSLFLADLGSSLTFRVEPGPSPSIRFPPSAPYDDRLGYAELPERIDMLAARGFAIESQARIRNVFTAPDGTAIPVGGKTGTGDHRFETYGKGGVVLSSEVISRSGTFVFFIGDRHFGTLTAYVKGPEAARYTFTSGLPVQILKVLAPTLAPVLGPVAGDASSACPRRMQRPEIAAATASGATEATLRRDE